MTLEDIEAWEEKAFALRLDIGALAGKLKKTSERLEELRTTLTTICISLETGVMDKEEAESTLITQLDLFE